MSNQEEFSSFQEPQQDFISDLYYQDEEPLPSKCQFCSSSLQQPSPSSISSNDPSLHGFKRLLLPHPFPATSPPPSPLRRTVSAPLPPLPSFSCITSPPRPTWQETVSAQESPNQPAHAIYRTVSDPTPAINYWPTATPPRPGKRSPSCCRESPNTKRLKRMKERLREMNQWWNQVLSEGQEDDQEQQDEEHHIGSDERCVSQEENIISKEECEGEKGNASDAPKEPVWVEKKGDCIILHLRCPCDNVNQILLTQNNCYYKLASF